MSYARRVSDTRAIRTVEDWAKAYVESESLAHKLTPPPVPDVWEDAPRALRLERPGRPPELRVLARAEKTRGLATARGRARAMHTFLHHELQAAELMAWAILAFPETPRAFREGLLRITLDEVRHMGMYARHIEHLGFRVGDFAVRDWFWTRVPSAVDAASFVAVMGLGLESANLDHAPRFAARFRAAGDEEGARVQELIGLEEIAHVRFGARWFSVLGGGAEGELDFDRWRRALPAPLTPTFMRGRSLETAARLRAGQTEAFLERLASWELPAEITPSDAPSS